MEHYLINSIDKLRTFLDRGEHEYVSVFGQLRHSYWINRIAGGIIVTDYSSGDDIRYSWEELKDAKYPIPSKIASGMFYCQTMNFYKEC